MRKVYVDVDVHWKSISGFWWRIGKEELYHDRIFK